MRLQPMFEDGNRDYPFVIVGLEIDGDTSEPFINVVTPKKFDTGGNFGGPRPLLRDDGLRNVIIDNDICSGFGIDDSTGWRYFLFRTGTPVSDGGKVGKYAITKLGLKAIGSVDQEFGFVQLGSGGWDDDSDGLPEPGEISCNAEAQTTMLIKQPPTVTGNRAHRA